MSNLGYFLGGMATGILGLAVTAVIHEKSTSGDSSSIEESSEDENADSVNSTTDSETAATLTETASA